CAGPGAALPRGDRLARRRRQARRTDRSGRPGRCDRGVARRARHRAPGRLRRLLLRGDGRAAVRGAAPGAARAPGRDQRQPSRASLRERLARAAAARGGARCAAVRRARRAVAGAAARDPELPHAGGVRRALRPGTGGGGRGARRGRGLPRPLRREVRRRHAAHGIPAAVGIHRPAGARSARRAGAGHRGRRRRGPPGPGPGCLRAGRAAAAPAPARAALALRPRCLPQGARGDRRRVARGPAPGAAPVSGLRAQTLAVRAGIDRDEAFGAVTPPLVLSSNFSFAGFDAKRTYDYSRSGNPTRDLFAGALAELEGGAGAVVTGSGMSAATLALHALLPRGARIVVPHDCYGGCWRLFDALSRKGQFTVATADLTDPRALAGALREPTALVWIETPSNPLLRITDLRFVVEAAHGAGA